HARPGGLLNLRERPEGLGRGVAVAGERKERARALEQLLFADAGGLGHSEDSLADLGHGSHGAARADVEPGQALVELDRILHRDAERGPDAGQADRRLTTEIGIEHPESFAEAREP